MSGSLGFMSSDQPLHLAKRVHTQLATEMPWNENDYSKMEKPFLASALQKEALGQSVSRLRREDNRKRRPSLFSCSSLHSFFKKPSGRQVEMHSRKRLHFPVSSSAFSPSQEGTQNASTRIIRLNKKSKLRKFQTFKYCLWMILYHLITDR